MSGRLAELAAWRRRSPSGRSLRARTASSARPSPAAAPPSSRRARAGAADRRAGAARRTRSGIELERVEELRLRTADVDCVQLPVRDGEERVAVRLHDVRLVDAFLLDVRAGEVDALLGRGAASRAPAAALTIRHLPAEPVGPDEASGLRLGVPEQVGAAAERDEAAGLGGGALARGLSGRASVVAPSAAAARIASAAAKATRFRKSITSFIRHKSVNRHIRKCEVLHRGKNERSKGLSTPPP